MEDPLRAWLILISRLKAMTETQESWHRFSKESKFIPTRDPLLFGIGEEEQTKEDHGSRPGDFPPFLRLRRCARQPGCQAFGEGRPDADDAQQGVMELDFGSRGMIPV